jgi:hypothetical protein
MAPIEIIVNTTVHKNQHALNCLGDKQTIQHKKVTITVGLFDQFRYHHTFIVTLHPDFERVR